MQVQTRRLAKLTKAERCFGTVIIFRSNFFINLAMQIQKITVRVDNAPDNTRALVFGRVSV